MRRSSGRAGGRMLLGATALLALLLLAAAGGSGCQPIRAGASGEVWLSTLSAEVQGNGTVAGTPIDLDANLGTGGGMQVVPGGEAWVQLWRIRLKGDLWRLSTDATTTLASTLIFEDTTFEAGGQVASAIDLLHARAALEFEILNDFSPWKINLGVGLGVSLIDLNFSMSELPPLSDVGTLDQLLPYPVAGVSFDITPISWLTVGVELYGLSTLGLIPDIEGHVIDLRAGLRYNIPGLRNHLGVGVQYRYWTVDVDSTLSDFNGSVTVTNQGAAIFVMGQF